VGTALFVVLALLSNPAPAFGKLFYRSTLLCYDYEKLEIAPDASLIQRSFGPR